MQDTGQIAADKILVTSEVSERLDCSDSYTRTLDDRLHPWIAADGRRLYLSSRVEEFAAARDARRAARKASR